MGIGKMGSVGRWGDGELTGPHSPKGVGIRGNGEMRSVRSVGSVGRWGE
jgi:hypothetical protein